MVNKANVVTADIMADNGVVHVIDAVILPKDVKVASLLKKKRRSKEDSHPWKGVAFFMGEWPLSVNYRTKTPKLD